jgi:hypothetical protein
MQKLATTHADLRVSFSNDVAQHRAYLNWIAKKLHITNYEQWYTVKQSDILHFLKSSTFTIEDITSEVGGKT